MRCPLVPAATGKLTICAANTNTAVRPAIGAEASVTSVRAPRKLTAMAPTASAPAAMDTGALMKPSGMCTPQP